MVFSLALKMLASEADAEDVVQETFIRVWQGIGGYDVRRPFVTWLYTIASRLCLDRIKRNRRLVPMPDDEIVLHRFAAETDSQRELENHEWMAIVRMLAAELSPKQRLVFTLSQLEGLTTEEIEQIAGLSARQVKSNLYVARQTIRERLKILGYE
jgi:RNA polymerase sigma-70 factor (ECF subfamily)